MKCTFTRKLIFLFNKEALNVGKVMFFINTFYQQSVLEYIYLL